MLFHNDTESKASTAPQQLFSDAVEEEEEEVSRSDELASTEPLLTPQSSQPFSSLAVHARLLTTPVQAPLHSLGDSSPFVLLDEHQVEVDVVAEAEISLEEAEEATESPLHKRLSMSLITCHEGATSSQIFAEVHRDGTTPVPSVEGETPKSGVDHSYALPSIAVEPESPIEPSPAADLEESSVQISPAQTREAEKLPSFEESKDLVKESYLPSASASSEPPTVSGPEQPQLCTGIRCPTFDSKSPSQVVFKPQWLGKGFGATGLRARAVQGHNGKGSSSPLALHVAIKNVTNENKGQSGKLKQKGVWTVCSFLFLISRWRCFVLTSFVSFLGTEGRSPLQILKETNSPRGQCPQVLYISKFT